MNWVLLITIFLGSEVGGKDYNIGFSSGSFDTFAVCHDAHKDTVNDIFELLPTAKNVVIKCAVKGDQLHESFSYKWRVPYEVVK